ncbi:MAG TPA: FAD-binding oxidoreductase [Solirubrobacteraceae bacterium]|nr:FAD-binding oxidoreductase [Solirubrobacteraceae bacterium]
MLNTDHPTTATVTAPTSVDDVLVVPGDAGWDAARQTFNLLHDQRPVAIATPGSEREVAAAVRYAAAQRLTVTAQATGHNAGPLGSLENTLIINTSRLQGVRIDVANERVRVGAGVKWGAVTPRLSELGLAALHGSSPDVGIVGYSLGGGMGWLARHYGLQSNSVTAIELVTADGDLIRADAVHEPDLFWALRGGGGNFGIVTAIEFAVYPVTEVYAGTMLFGFERASEVLRMWHAMLPYLPEEITSQASLMHIPDLPFVPDMIRGGSFVGVTAAFLGDEIQGQRLLAPIRDLGPVLDTFDVVAPAALGDLSMDPPEPLPYMSEHDLLGGLAPRTIDELIAAVPRESGVVSFQLRHMRGAIGRAPSHAGSRGKLEGELAMFAVGVVPDPAFAPILKDSLAGVKEAVRSHRLSAPYANFVEKPTDARAFYDAATWSRLRSVKALYDPSDLFRGNHHIPPSH